MRLTPAMRPSFPRAVLAPALALALALSACGGEDQPDATAAADATDAGRTEPAPAVAEPPSELDRLRARVPPALPARSGPARPYALGFTATPALLTPDAYVDVFDDAARSADVVMIQRPVAWAEVGPDGAVRPETRATIAWERQLLDERGLDLLFAIDPWDLADRGRLAGEAPGESFQDEAVSGAYVAYAEFVVREYRPRWLALAVDLDAVVRARPDDLDAIEAAYRRAYAAVKAIAPETLVFATFQLEDLQGLVPWSEHLPQWSLVLRFQDVLDVLAVSSYPSLIFPFASDIPDSYYSRLETFQKPIALVPGGYASAPGRDGVTFGTLRGQQRFLQRVLREAEAGGWALVVWLMPEDPAFTTAAPFDLFARMGLRAAGGAAKPAWAVWAGSAARPWQPGLAAGGDGAPAAAE